MFMISSMCTVSGMLSVIACALPSITGMGVFTFSLLFLVKKLVLSFAERKGENFFVFQKMPLTSAFSLSLSFTHWTCITNFLERDCVGGWMGNKKPHICQVEKQSRQIALTCQRVWHHQVPPWENEKLCTHTKHSIPANVFFFFFFLTIWYSSFLSRLLNLQLMLLRFINPYFLGAFSSHSRAAMQSHSLVTPLLSNTNSSDTCSDTTWTLISILNWSEIRFSLQWNNKVICAFFTFSFSKLSNTAFSLAAGLHLIRSSYLLTVNSRNIYTRNNSACIGNTTL